MKGAELFISCLENEGCKIIFGLPGEETLEILEAVKDSSIRFFLTRHEATASFAANAYGRMTMQPGVCLSTLGPGAVNLAIGVADAYLDRAPLLAVTGQTESSKLGMRRHQLIDLQEFFRPITKWTAALLNGDSIPEKVRKAFRVAKTVPMGPTHLDFPVDVQSQETSKSPLPRETKWIVKEPIDPQMLKEVAKKIDMAGFPVIVTGLSCVRRGHHESLRKFAEAYDIPVVTTPLSRGVLLSGHKLDFGTISPLCSRVVIELLRKADLIIAVGYDFIEVDTSRWLKPGTEVIHIDYIPADVDESYHASIEVLGNIGVVLDALTKLAKRRKKMPLAEYRERLARDMSEGESSNVFPVKPQRLIRDLRDACDKNAVVCVDTGAVKYLMTRYWKIYARRTFFLSNGLASMGFAVPAAIAGKIVFPERQVLAVVGDGGLQMSLSDFKTISENNLDITIVVFDNSGYGILAAKQQDLNVDIFGTRFGNPDFCKIAEASGIKAYSVQKANDVLPTIQEALTDGRASLVHVPVERDEARLMGL